MRIVRSNPLAVAGITLGLLLSVSTYPAQAANTFLLQFGEHGTQEAARAQWNALRNANPSLLGDLDFHMAEVQAQGGGTAFRTQAGALSNHAEAQSVCTGLAVQGIECLVVETSMYMPAQAEEVQPVQDVEVPIITSQVVGAETAAPDEVVTLDPAIEAPSPAAAPTPEKRRSFKEALLPWFGFGKDSDEPQVAPQQTAAQPVPAPQQAPAQGAAPAAEELWPSYQPDAPVDTPAAATSQYQQAAPQQSAASAEKPVTLENGMQIIPSRAPRPLQAPEDTQQDVATQSMESDMDYGDGSTTTAQVDVAEAIRVPLSIDPQPVVPTTKPVGYGGFPSQPLPSRTLWVQINYFTGKEAAMEYWRHLSYQYPDMMRMLRVRIISPWQSRSRQVEPRSSLRMGPFSSQQEINELCNVASRKQLSCSLVKDMGTSASARNNRSLDTQSARYDRRAATPRGYGVGERPGATYWIQLGAFSQVEEAQARWQVISSVHGDILGRMQPQISYPALSSSAEPVYHLRTGPFVRQGAADNACEALKARHLGCIIVRSW